MRQYAKAIMAFFTALGTWGYTSMSADPNGVASIAGAEWFGLCGVIVTTAAVWAIPNNNDPNSPGMLQDNRGHTVLWQAIVAAVAATIITIALMKVFGLL